MCVTNVERRLISRVYEASKANEGHENLQADVNLKAFGQAGHGIPPISSAQASSAIDHPSSSKHTGMV
jgi:hypothetical protein